MEERSYKNLASGSFLLFTKILKQSYLAILGLSAFQCVFKLVCHFFPYISHKPYYMLFFNVIFKPFLIILLFGCIASYFKKKVYDKHLILSGVKRFYPRFIAFYAILGMLVFYLGSGAGTLIYMILFLRFPFLEAMMYFDDTSIAGSFKRNYDEVQGKLLRYMIILLFSFTLIRFVSSNILGSIYFTQHAPSAKLVFAELIESMLIFLSYTYIVSLFIYVYKGKVV